MFKLRIQERKLASSYQEREKAQSKQIKPQSSLILQSRERREDGIKMTSITALMVLDLWRSDGNITELRLTNTDVLTAFRREISAIQFGGKHARGYSICDFHQAYQTLLTRMKNNKLKLKMEKKQLCSVIKFLFTFYNNSLNKY